MALFAAVVGAGDEVIVGPLTDYGSIIGIFQLNAIPVFADVARDSFLCGCGRDRLFIPKSTPVNGCEY